MGADHGRRDHRHAADLVVFVVFQRYIIRGVVLAGLKG
jgi:hypothetical protein